jgi:hypothetical protein
MQYITELASSNVTKSETPVPLPPKYNVMYPVDAPVRTVKNSFCTQNSVARHLSEYTAHLKDWVTRWIELYG